MDTVTHNGTEYKKVAKLAKEFNYTSDYIGQLCRAEKVDARLVGRAWYVNPLSLEEHKKQRYQDNFKAKLEDEKDTPTEQKNYLSRVDVEAVRTNKTHKIIRHIKGEFKELSVTYETDDGSLLPKIIKQEKATSVPVDLADADEIKIKKEPGKVTILKPTALPEVALKGKLEVSDVPEKASLPVVPAKGETSEVETIRLTNQSQKTQQHSNRRPGATRTLASSQIQKKDNNPIKYSHLGKESLQQQKPVRPAVSFHPSTVSTASVSRNAKQDRISINQSTHRVAILFLLFFALLSAGLILTVGNSSMFEREQMTNQIYIDYSALDRLINI